MTFAILEKTKIEVPELPIKTLPEFCFWDEDDTRWGMFEGKGIESCHTAPLNMVDTVHDIDLSTDSYIFVYAGRRGAGKTTSMTDEAAKAAVIYPKMRLLSNYPIEFNVRYLNGRLRHIKSENLDLYKLLCFDDDYKDCLILIDEAPDIISHMASQTWKNRLLNIFIRQLRKNHNSLMMGAQEFTLIDKSMRWQVDIIVKCEDASRKNGWPSSERGKLIYQNWLDNSGMWTGQTYEEQEARNRSRGIWEDVGEPRELEPVFLWGDDKDGGHRAVFDTYFMQDVWESLRKVDVHLDSYKIGDTTKPEDIEDESTGNTPVMLAANLVRKLIHSGAPKIAQKDFWASLGKLDSRTKNSLAQRLVASGLNNRMPQEGRDRMYGLTTFDMDRFLATPGEDKL